MKPLLTLAVVGLLGVICQTAPAQAVIEGHVKLPQETSVEVIQKRYQLSGEQAVIAPDPPAAVLYLEGNFGEKKAAPRAQMIQKNLDFIPRLLPVQVGTTVEFPNEDDTYHSIFSFSQPKRFDLGRYPKNETPVPSEVFDKPGPVVLRCDIHEHMRAIILVLETPYFGKTDPQGNYRVGNLPAGHYKFAAWLNDKTILEKQVDLKNGATLHVDFP
jgi:plastocyanin